MTFDEYQRAAARTANTSLTRSETMAHNALGLCGEAGECGEHVKKHLFFGRPIDRDAVIKELGDVMWHVARLADDVGVSLSEVAERNIAKLRARYPEGYSHEACAQRADVNEVSACKAPSCRCSCL